jgi:hypothetical protein
MNRSMLWLEVSKKLAMQKHMQLKVVWICTIALVIALSRIIVQRGSKTIQKVYVEGMDYVSFIIAFVTKS